ncbi:MAG TPA: hypothetical protein VIC57_19605 [Candidatus Dormibacteraeota bacterium]|jgi:hypothetical protein
MANSRDVTRRQQPRPSTAWLRAARRFCVMTTSVTDLGEIGFTVLDLRAQAVDTRHQTPEAARRRADDLVAGEMVRLAGDEPS